MIEQEIPIYIQLIQSIKKGFTILDTSTQAEIIDFIKTQQNKNGGFADRSGKSDPYYSLFGHWLCFALNLEENDFLLKQYIEQETETRNKSLIDKLAFLLISVDLFPNKVSISVFSILKYYYKERHSVNFAYLIFLFMLLVDAVGKNKRLYKIIAKFLLRFYNPGKNIPCSLLSAMVFTKYKTGIKYKKAQSRLIMYCNKNGGFKSFHSIENSDMLSTSVTLFVLKKTGYKVWVFKTGCLNFVEENYDSGAFLSGDGDKTKDLEYTFYGLLALGSLV